MPKAKKSEQELYDAWLAEVKEGLGDDAELKKAFEVLTSKPVGREKVFKGGYRQDDYYTRLNELNEEKLQRELELQRVKEQLDTDSAALQEWYEKNAPIASNLAKEKRELQEALEEAKKALKDYDPEAAEAVSRGRGGRVTEKNEQVAALEAELRQLKAQMTGIDTGVPVFFGGMMEAYAKAVKEGFNVTPKQILDYSMQNKVDPEMAFERLTASERAEKEKAAVEKKVKEAVELALAEERKKRIASPDRLTVTELPGLQAAMGNAKVLGRADRLNHALEAWTELGDN